MPTSQVINTGILDLIAQASLTVKLVLLLLLVASVFCWAIIFMKLKLMKNATREDRSFLVLFWKSKSLDEISTKIDKYKISPLAAVFMAGFKELQKLSHTERTNTGREEVENINRSLNRSSQDQIALLEKHISWLATIASAAPFVGLFGTVWGIMNSFRHIGMTGSANLAVVAPGISEALIATAIGLAAAIPAVVAYNYLVNRIRGHAVKLECFCQDFLNIIQRGLMGGHKK